MNPLPTNLTDCISMISRVCGQLQAELTSLPATQAHTEVAGLMTQLQEMAPELVDRHNHLMSLIETTHDEIKQNLSEAEAHLQKGRDIRDGKFSREEVQIIQQEMFGNQFTPPPVPEMPGGWSSILEEELLNSANPEQPAPILPTESNAWNDWQLESNA